MDNKIKLQLQDIQIESFVTDVKQKNDQAGIIGPSGAYTCIVYCTVQTFNFACP